MRLCRSALFLDELEDTLLDCMEQGKWLILDDCHHVKKWPENFIQLLTAFTTTDPKLEEDQSTVRHSVKQPSPTDSKLSVFKSSLDNTSSVAVRASYSDFGNFHPDFRIWMIMKKSAGDITCLPVILMRKAEFITLESSTSHKDLVKKTHRTLLEASRLIRSSPLSFPSHPGPSFLNRVPIPYNIQVSFYRNFNLSEKNKQLILELSLLFTTLIERASFKKSAFSKIYSWSDGEALDAMKSMFLVSYPSYAKNLFAQILERHMSDSR